MTDTFLISETGDIVSPGEFQPTETRHQRPPRLPPLQERMIRVGQRVLSLTPPAISLRGKNFSFLSKSCEADLTAFRDWLHSRGYSSRTVSQHMQDAKAWNRHLAGDPLTRQTVTSVLEGIGEGSRQSRMRYSLNVYSRYRSDTGDPSLLMLLASAQLRTSYRRPRRKKRVRKLSPGERWSLTATARILCQAGDKSGIHIILTLMGVHPGSMRRLDVSGEVLTWTHNRKRHTIRVGEEWILKALREAEGWRTLKEAVYRSCKAYGHKPSDILGQGILERRPE